MGEVETEPVGGDERALLLDVRAERLAQCVMDEVRGRVVVLRRLPQVLVDHRRERACQVLRQRRRNVHPQVVLLDGVVNLDFLVDILKITTVAQLAARFGIERTLVQHNLEKALAFGFDLSVFQNLAFAGKSVVADKLGRMNFVEFHPVLCFDSGGGTRTGLLLSQTLLETFHIHQQSLFGGQQLGEVDRETVGIKEFKSEVAGHGLSSGQLGAVVLKLDNTRLQGLEERSLLFGNNFLYQNLLGFEFRELRAHLRHEVFHQRVDEGLVEAEESVAIADGAAQDAADDIARARVGGQLPVGDGETHGAQVVGHYAERDVGLVVFTVLLVGKLRQFLDQRLEHVGVVVRLLALNSHAEAFEAHAGIHVLGGQRHQLAGGQTVELHENEIPYLNH